MAEDKVSRHPDDDLNLYFLAGQVDALTIICKSFFFAQLTPAADTIRDGFRSRIALNERLLAAEVSSKNRSFLEGRTKSLS